MNHTPSILFMLLLPICAQAEAPDVQLTLTLPEKAITIGEPVEVILTATYPTNGILTVPSLERKKELVQLQLTPELPRQKSAFYEQRFIYRCTSFRLGSHLIDGKPLQLQLGEEVYQMTFPTGLLEVCSSLAEHSDDQSAPIREPFRHTPMLPRGVWLIIIALLFAVLIGWGFRKLRPSIRKPHEDPCKPVLPPHVIALRALQMLEHDLRYTPKAAKAFFTELSLILRTYLHGRFHLNAPEKTREEIRSILLQSLELHPDQQASLNRFFDEAEQIKFAKGEASSRAMQQALSSVRQFIEQTAQHEPPTEEL